MSNRLNGFDKLASVYDRLASLVFGRALYHAQKVHLNNIPPASTVVVLGGGSGAMLRPLFGRFPTRVVYIEASAAMLARAQEQFKNHPGTALVEWVHGTEEDLANYSQFDAVITQFVLDCYSEATLPTAIHNIRQALKADGHWLVADFGLTQNAPWWQRALIWTMYRFFRLTAQIEATELLPYDQYLKDVGLKEVKRATFYHHMVFATVYEAQASANK